ncbi:alpha/beta fold hydrolase [Plantactinospora mayteni]|uniref:Thioesterase n=1 Tax=Plantactinospora mayteni TaxID=566021 RepID=A0ABQ4EIA5_9ACTN|nr:thioesterase domain-containing protein [Plantactinospora mayteni]GIG94458.1 thioesterase [Plantactinospora mayteni]
MTDARDWFLPVADDTGLRVFAFPHAGAGCAQLAPFGRAAAAQGMSVWAANLPGRQARLDEPARTRFEDLAEELVDEITGRLDQPYVLLGYCGGALLAYGLARMLRARSATLPLRLVVVSYEAPDIARRPRRIAHLPADLLWTELVESGGVPASLGRNPRLQKVAEPAVRADFTWLAGYRHQPDLPLPIPVTVSFGRADGSPRGAFLGWRRHTSHPLDVRLVDGGHWLLDDACDALAAQVAAAVSGDLPAAPRAVR